MNWENRFYQAVPIFSVIAVSVIIGMFGWLAWNTCSERMDTDGVTLVEGTGAIVEKHHQPARYLGVPIPSYYRPTWRVRVRIDGWQDTILVSSTYFRDVEIGQIVRVQYQIGRSGTHYLRAVH